ncbi:class III lanthionine synthetase LanKC [Actinoallomurus iriomotensis]|uniref:Serine/threonine protein kinase n=1 Tax=Actinoallomurus iriomotensis TaxID=478107 RepID=A0A9W6VMX0_9ACTN|nr:class III lanthionine synthetase LanKC [Actinoallomurus iriomotensis]GLY73149.1 serine/threonine protein kinase [Actinoallomurus iriomotensis]
MPANKQLLQPFCIADPIFFDSPERIPDEAERFPAARRAAPPGWHRHERGAWVFLRPGDSTLPAQGWKIHVSAVPSDAAKVCEIVWDYCVGRRIAVKFLRSEKAVLAVNDKYADRSSSGKAVTLYPADDTELAAVLTELSELLAGFPGPYILSDLRYGNGPLYVRYGGFIERTCPGDDGEPVPALEGPDGRLVPDERASVFTVPDWVAVPEVLRPHVAAWQSDGDEDFPFHVEAALHHSNGGGVYLARDTRSGEQVVLREARPHAGLDRDRVDAVTRLAAERGALERLAGLDCVPRLLEHRVAWEHHFLVEEYIEGTTLLDAILVRYPLTNREPTAQALAGYTDWALDVADRLERAVEAVHGRGIRIGDLHPGNVMVRPDGRVALIDFELATELEDDRAPALAAPGFTAPAHLSGAAADRYLVECIRLFLFLPVYLRGERAPGRPAVLVDAVQRHFPVPPDFGGHLLRTLQPTTIQADPVVSLLTAEEPDWPALRDSLVAGIHASATPHREDRLFPGSPVQFEHGGYAFAYGAAGVLYALDRVGAEVPDEYVDWLIQATRRARTPQPGLFDGLHGVAATLHLLGRREAALDVLDRARELSRGMPAPGLLGGWAGIGLNLLHFARVTGDSELRAAAVRIADELAGPVAADANGGRTRRPGKAGLLTGMTGAALLFLHLHEDTADPAYLDLARSVLLQEMSRGEHLDDGTFQLGEGGGRYRLYLGSGSGGLALVLQEYLKRRDDPEMAAVITRVRRGCWAPFVVQPGLFDGRAGLLAVLAQLGAPEDRPAVDAHIRRLAWHAEPYEGHLAFPGDKLLRLSMDLATGSAGILLALNAALEGTSTVLPYLDPQPAIAHTS